MKRNTIPFDQAAPPAERRIRTKSDSAEGYVTTPDPEDREEGVAICTATFFLSVTTKGKYPIKVYLNVEAQNTYNKKYTIPAIHQANLLTHLCRESSLALTIHVKLYLDVLFCLFYNQSAHGDCGEVG